MFESSMRRVAGAGGLYVFLAGATGGPAIYLYLAFAAFFFVVLSRALTEIDIYRARRAERARAV